MQPLAGCRLAPPEAIDAPARLFVSGAETGLARTRFFNLYHSPSDGLVEPAIGSPRTII